MNPGPLMTEPKRFLAADTGEEVIEAAARPAKTTNMANTRMASFIFGNLSCINMAG
jgi:hypothetical protein